VIVFTDLMWILIFIRKDNKMTTSEILRLIKSDPQLNEFYVKIHRLKDVKSQFDQLKFETREDVLEHRKVIDELWELTGDLVHMISLYCTPSDKSELLKTKIRETFLIFICLLFWLTIIF